MDASSQQGETRHAEERQRCAIEVEPGRYEILLSCFYPPQQAAAVSISTSGQRVKLAGKPYDRDNPMRVMWRALTRPATR